MKRSRTLTRKAYIAEALLEYLVSILVTGTFLAAILKNIGVSDALAGIISSFTTFTCCAQLFSNLIEKPGRHLRRTLILFAALNELLFAGLYLIPSFPFAPEVKSACFVVMILLAYICLYLSTPVKYRWLMDSVDADKRGSFTAKKEIVSLIGGMVFSLGMGRVVDHFRETGRDSTGFAICCAAMVLVSVGHIITIFLAEDEIVPEKKSGSGLKEMVRFLLTNKPVRLLLVFDILWKTAVGISTPFFGTYTIGELGYTLTQVSLFSIVTGLARAMVSPFTGRYADRKGWRPLLALCVSVSAAGFFIMGFAAPGTAWLYVAGQILYCMAMAGINGGISNINYDYIDKEHFSMAFGTRQAVSGIVGFLASLVGSTVVSKVQAGGNVIFGMTVYAQQLLSGAGAVMMVIAVIYLATVIRAMPRIGGESGR